LWERVAKRGKATDPSVRGETNGAEFVTPLGQAVLVGFLLEPANKAHLHRNVNVFPVVFIVQTHLKFLRLKDAQSKLVAKLCKRIQKETPRNEARGRHEGLLKTLEKEEVRRS